jgi:hypothetical protein
MRKVGGWAVLLLVASGAAAQVDTAATATAAVPVADPDEVIVFDRTSYRGAFMRLRVGDELPNLEFSPDGNWESRISSVKVGSEAVVVLFSSFDYKKYCLALPGQALGGAGYYPDLSNIRNKNLRAQMNDMARSIRVLGKDTDLASACQPPKRK